MTEGISAICRTFLLSRAQQKLRNIDTTRIDSTPILFQQRESNMFLVRLITFYCNLKSEQRLREIMK